MLGERREPLPEGLGVLLAEIDLVLRAAYREPDRLVGVPPSRSSSSATAVLVAIPGPP